MVKAKNKKLKSKKTKDKKMNTKTITLPKKNIETKIDAKSGKASGNLFKKDPIVSNNPSVKVGKTLSGKIDFSKNKKNELNVKSGQQVSGKVTKSN